MAGEEGVEGDVWVGPTAGPSTADPDLPSVMDILVESFEDFQTHASGYLLAGFGYALVLIPLSMASVPAILGAAMAGAVPGAMRDDELLMSVGALVGYLIGIALMIAVLAVVGPPLQASVGSAVLRRITEQTDLAFGDAFATWRTDMGKVIGTYLLQSFMVGMGILFCYVPGILAAILIGFAMPAVIVHRLSPVEAMRLSVGHVMAHPTWHLGYSVVVFGIGMAVSYLPFVGFALAVTFLQSFQLRCYTAVFGVAPQPEGWTP